MLQRQKIFFKEAERRLNAAKEDLYKPQGDMLTFSVCKNSQHAVENYLMGYLIKENIPIEEKDTLNNLFEKCIELNSDLKQVSLDSFSKINKSRNTLYYSVSDEATACYNSADSLDTFFRKNNII